MLPHVIDVVEAMADDAPLLHEDLFTAGVEPAPAKPSNVAKRVEFAIGDIEAGFAEADVVVEREFDTKPVHQGYIEPHACVASVSADGQAELWCSTQGALHRARATAPSCSAWTSRSCGSPRPRSAAASAARPGLSRAAGAGAVEEGARPVKMVMSREEVFRPPARPRAPRLGQDRRDQGRQVTAAEAVLAYQAGAFPGSPVAAGLHGVFAPYDLPNVRVDGYDVVTNRPKVAAYRAPGAPIAAFAVECVIDELAEKLGIDPIEFRLKNAAKEGTRAAYGPTFADRADRDARSGQGAARTTRRRSGPNQGRGVASGFWFNIGGETSAAINVNEDGTVTLIAGTPDIGGSRASSALMAAEELGIPSEKVRPIVADTSSVGYTDVTGGSRATFATGVAVNEAAQQVIKEMCERAAKIWEIPADAVTWEDGMAKPAGANAGDSSRCRSPSSPQMAGKTGGPIAGHAHLNAQGAGAELRDPPGRRRGRPRDRAGHDPALHGGRRTPARRSIRAYVEGQMQGGAVQGIGWALNEEYIYDADGRMQNASFLDYRMPVASTCR